jgi:putative hydrolase of the HAD superfamily
MQLKAVAFDLDGTLYPNSSLYMRAVPLFFKNPLLIAAFGRIRRELRLITPINDFYALQRELLAKELKITEEKAAKIIEEIIYPTWQSVLKQTKLYSGVRLVIEDLKRQGLKLGVLSDFPVQKKLRFLHIDGVWDYEYSTEEVGYLKPNSEPFYHMAESLHVAPEDIIYVGNNYELDMVGASKAGLKTAYLSRRKGVPLPDIIFSRYSDLIPKMKSQGFL